MSALACNIWAPATGGGALARGGEAAPHHNPGKKGREMESDRTWMHKQPVA